MWSDTLLLAERAHLVRLLGWGAASMLLGSAILALLAVRRVSSPLLANFAIQTAAWGTLDLALAALAWRALAPRDISGATRLDRLLWLNTGLDVGYVAVGITLVITGWVLGRRLAPIGAGLGIIVQGAALLLLDVRFIAIIRGLTVA
ncbi:MAG: DUF6992 family protein [Gemmatimonadaceae bacterium]